MKLKVKSEFSLSMGLMVINHSNPYIHSTTVLYDSSGCNVLRQWSISLIPTYRVYQLYDSSSSFFNRPSAIVSVSSDARLHINPFHFLAHSAVCPQMSCTSSLSNNDIQTPEQVSVPCTTPYFNKDTLTPPSSSRSRLLQEAGPVVQYVSGPRCLSI